MGTKRRHHARPVVPVHAHPRAAAGTQPPVAQGGQQRLDKPGKASYRQRVDKVLRTVAQQERWGQQQQQQAAAVQAAQQQPLHSKQQQVRAKAGSSAPGQVERVMDAGASEYKRPAKRRHISTKDSDQQQQLQQQSSACPVPQQRQQQAKKQRQQQQQPAAVGSNWAALQQQLAAAAAAKPAQNWRRQRLSKAAAAGGGKDTAAAPAAKRIGSIGRTQGATPILALDCEMVGVGPDGDRDSLARVSIVNASGNVVYDSHVAQAEHVTDYRTWVSGVTAEHLVGAPSLAAVQADVAALLKGRTLVGHGLSKDLRVLMLSHPRKDIRDTAKYPPFMFSRGGKRRPRALRHLADQELGIAIQDGSHSSVDDARAALYLYQKHSVTWERALRLPGGMRSLPTVNRAAAGSSSSVSKRKRAAAALKAAASRDVHDDPLADL